MPEGDTIHRIAAKLAPRLTGLVLERVTTQGLTRDIAGRTVASVAAHGKHLVIELDDGAYLRMHLGMYGRFRAYDRKVGDAALAKLSPGRASLAITTRDGVYVWVGARTVEISHRRSPMHGQAIASLGPDILGDGFDPHAAAERALGRAERTISDVLLDQRVVAGIGNIYKCEALFARGIDPREPIGRLDRLAVERLYTAARELMLDNLGPSPRATRQLLSGDRPDQAERYFVYGRSGKPCRRCEVAAIDCYQLGDPPRWTWSCPHCQPRVSCAQPTG
ncbi:MAG: formamidopyrimidine-DNA glycosylase [Myxococcales bacterium]|nr:formamidopyrimidine-DNA glycosylase [Myxococcales bacterium]